MEVFWRRLMASHAVTTLQHPPTAATHSCTPSTGTRFPAVPEGCSCPGTATDR